MASHLIPGDIYPEGHQKDCHGTGNPMDDEHDRCKKFYNAQVAGIRPVQVLPAAKYDEQPNHSQKPEATQDQDQ